MGARQIRSLKKTAPVVADAGRRKVAAWNWYRRFTTPSPYLRGHQVDDRNSGRFKPGRQAQVKVRRIGQDRQIRRVLARRVEQLAIFAINARDMRRHLD